MKPILDGSENVAQTAFRNPPGIAITRSRIVTRKTVAEIAYYVYVLRSQKSGRLYIGSSADPDARLKAHNAGRSQWSRRLRPWVRVRLEEHPNRQTAEKRERYLKSGWGRRWLSKQFDVERCQSG
ncbi:MAG TPA: GIY-YIG nuclease family protein [Verrucomicrobiae bacterium]|nr:GIY-YIG nuclease family protein [Verrucomicrobiae bacterium]